MILHIVYILVSLVLLWKGSDWLVERAVRIAAWMGVSQLVIGLTVVAFGTSAPEFAVSIGAALSGQANISVSNVIGSNIYNLGFILGGVALFQAIHADRNLIYRDGGVLLAVSVLLVAFIYDLEFSRAEGIVMFAGLIVYNVYLIRQRTGVEVETKPSGSIFLDWLVLIAGLVFVVAGGILLRVGAVAIAQRIGISNWVIGVTLIAGGTSAPEFATSLMASYRGHHGISAGNLIGSCIFNLMGVLGIAGILRPLKVAAEAQHSTLMMLSVVVLSLFFFRTGWKLSRAEGALLVLAGIAIWAYIL
ncbi:calcium/sodium antiporter [bacterium]|nr:calcium/sodium antiporter [bacterium]